MGSLVDLLEWQRRRSGRDGPPAGVPGDEPPGEHPALSGKARRGDAGAHDHDEGARPDLARLDRAIRRLEPLASAALDHGGLEMTIETELLAIMGAVSMDMLEDAAARAERLAGRLGATRRAGKEAVGKPLTK
jgi:hypothetical protein